MPRLRRPPVMLPEPLAERLAARAAASGESRATIMRMVLDRHLRDLERDEAPDRVPTAAEEVDRP